MPRAVLLLSICPLMMLACNPSPHTTLPKPSRPKVGQPPKTKPTPEAQRPTAPAAPDWSTAGSKAKVGDVEVEILWAGVTDYSVDEGARLGQYCATVFQFKLTNTSATKIRKFDGWSRTGKLTDEHDNEFTSFVPANRFASHPIPDEENKAPKQMKWPYLIAADLSMHPGESYGTYLLFDKVPKASKELRLTLPATAIGGTGELRFKMPLTFRQPLCDR